MKRETEDALAEVCKSVEQLARCLDNDGGVAYADWLRSWIYDLTQSMPYAPEIPTPEWYVP